VHEQACESQSLPERPALTFACCIGRMAKPPHRRSPPQKRKSDLPAGEAVASRAVVPNKSDPRQAGNFDRPLPAFIRPQLAKLVTKAPEGERWAHELKFDGYRMHARIDRGRVQLITAPSGLDWMSKYPATAQALKTLPATRAYSTANSARSGRTARRHSASCRPRQRVRAPPGPVYFVFDAVHLDGEDLLLQPLLERKGRLAEIMRGAPGSLQSSDHIVGNGPTL
jgi:ATP-dependent DNA ligase